MRISDWSSDVCSSDLAIFHGVSPMGSFSTPSAAYLVAATSPITLPIVRKMSGKVSTATSSPKGATGTPIDTAIGAIEVTKLIEPGRLTEESEAAIETARPHAIPHDVSACPHNP